jgi:hypothetical protein
VVQAEEHRRVVAAIAGQEEVVAGEAVAGVAHPLPLLGAPQQIRSLTSLIEQRCRGGAWLTH